MSVGFRELGFYLDADSCSGCKACQVACKDRNGLEVGRLWRRVYEISGGEWERSGNAWLPNIFAYHLSVSCNHCRAPICAEICPAKAIVKREDGIVLLDSEKCIGCGYCKWACPYDALQYDEAEGLMGKCDFCVAEIDSGHLPACVAACPMRVLEFGELSVLRARTRQANGCFPLPDSSLTMPSLLVTAHRDTPSDGTRQTKIAPAKQQALNQRPLIAFTLLAQAAVGLFLSLPILQTLLDRNGAGVIAAGAGDLLLPTGELLILLAILSSLRHLGKPMRAHRALAGLKRSWLSREIVSLVALATAGALLVAMHWFDAGTDQLRIGLGWLMALFGVALIICMSRVYMLRTIPPWNRWLTPFQFVTTSLLLGGTTTGALIISRFPFLAGGSGSQFLTDLAPLWRAIGIGLILLLGTAALIERGWLNGTKREGAENGFDQRQKGAEFSWHRWLFLLWGGSIMMALLFSLDFEKIEQPAYSALAILALLLIVFGEVLGKRQFFAAYQRSGI
jgi:anaerobic dimethyl sulfoxide reductase subunit B (iron-sulfur subunit)